MKIKTKIEIEINKNKYTIENDLYNLGSILSVLDEFNKFFKYEPNKKTIDTLFMLLEKLNKEKIKYYVKDFSKRQINKKFEIEIINIVELDGNETLEGITIEDNKIIIYEYYRKIGIVKFNKELLKTNKFIPLIKKLYKKQKKEKEKENEN